ncbi:MAG: DEAD/DEAH box helicase family protein [Thermosipho sp. (in: Bacteria)]|nr:DEAD/DEAH box helicase family protein [Thermosipho sp. (in: thermotogales)]
MSNFITNSGEKDLKKRFSRLILASKELKFLVGFFYFSGIKELYESLKANEEVIIKILVGLNVDKLQHEIIEFSREQLNLSEEEIRIRFFESLKNAFNTKNFDNKEFYEQVKFFIKLIDSGRLIIRKTFEPNHGKLYIFKLRDDQIGRQKLFITGSSNLTKSGLDLQKEFNVEISDYGVDEAEKFFDELWENSVEITESEIVRKKIVEIIQKETLIREITPFEAYVWVLKNYIETFQKFYEDKAVENLLLNAGYTPYRYQIDAVYQALSIIEKHNGVIIADVVGLGKSIIASIVARKLGKRGVVICPPGIMGDPKVKDSGWNRYIEEFGLRNIGWEVWSLGDLEKLNEFVKKNNDIEIIIVDEAHRFRNEDTRSYELLKNICRNKKVILLTATPFNNRPSDILALLKLFIIPKKSSITLEDDLLKRFSHFKTVFDKLGFILKYHNSSDYKKRNKAIRYYKDFFEEEVINLNRVKRRSSSLAKEIRNVIEPVTIRRNRLDLQKNPYYKDEVKNLSRVAEPREWFFELTSEQSRFFDEILTIFSEPENGGKFKGAMYRPFEYEKKVKDVGKLSSKESFEYHSQRNLYDIMRRLLVKRFESSFGAFKQSIINFKNLTEIVLKFVKKTGKYVLDRDLIEKIHELELDEIEEHLKRYEEETKKNNYPKHYKVYKLEDFQLKEKFLSDLETDLKLFENILANLNELKLVEQDPKLKCLIRNVQKVLNQKTKGEPKRKIVIFSEYTDTIKYLEKRLRNIFRNNLLVVHGSLTNRILKQIIENFDASIPLNKQKDDFDILLTTDKLSEGFNLNRAGMVINYDVPWNPVRVIQRLGRINRISKKVFDELYIVNFFPSEKGADIVKSREIATQKMFMIHNVLGEDAKIFDVDEEPTPSDLYQKFTQNPEEFEEESFYTKVLNEYEKIKRNYPEIVKNLENLPPRVKVAKAFNKNELIVFFKKFDNLYAMRCSLKLDSKLRHKVNVIEMEEAIENIKCQPDKLGLDWNNENFWKAYEEIINYKDIRRIPTEKSLEFQALNVIKTLLLRKNELPEKYVKFLRMLREDIIDYGTLADYTLRRISNINIESIKKCLEDIESLKKDLGENYLEKEKTKIKTGDKEIIVAIFNKKEEKGGRS